MSDLSHLLGNVYGGHRPDAEPPRDRSAARPVEVPEWADDSRLDEAFADWMPGPGPEAPAVERRLMGEHPAATPPALDDDLAAALSAALVDASRPAPPARPAGGRTTPLRPLVDWDQPPPARAPAPPAPALATPPPPPPPAAGRLWPAAAPAQVAPAQISPASPPPPPPPPPPPAAASHHWAPDEQVIAPASAVAAHRSWSPGDDDITPSGRGQRRGRRR